MKINEPERIEYIDSAKAVSIIMIMLGHITALGNPVDLWMSSCKICVFYVISGFLLAYRNTFSRRTPTEYIKNILQTIAWPYLTFSLIAIAVKCFYTFSKHKGWDAVADTFLDCFYKFLFMKGINSMWFLPTIFFGELILLLLFLSPLWIRLIYGGVGLMGLWLANSMTSFIGQAGFGTTMTENLFYLVNMFGKSMVAAWFLGFGYLLYRMLLRRNIFEGHPLLKLILGGIFTISNLFLSQLNANVDFNLMSMGDRPVLFLFGGTIGSVGMIFLLDFISQHISMSGLNFWGRNSLILMCTHTAMGFKGIAVGGWRKVAYIPDHPGLEYIVESCMALAVLMLIMYSVIIFINRYLPMLTRFPGRK